jgi:hypothetical protein
MILRIAAAIGIFVIVVIGPAFPADQLPAGAVIVAGTPPSGFEPAFNVGYVKHYSAQGTFQRNLLVRQGSLPHDIASDRFGNVYVADFHSVVRFLPDGTLVSSRSLPGVTTSIVADAGGNLFVGEERSSRPFLTRIAANGQVSGTPIPGDMNDFLGVQEIEMASDQCTLFYAVSRFRILRYLAPGG